MDEQQLFAMRHSVAHILAAAINELYPGTKFGVGPVIENGFYYDVLLPENKTLAENDLPVLEKKMKEIIARSDDFIKEEMSVDSAIAFFESAGQDFKVALLNDLKTKGSTSVRAEESQDIDAARVDSASVYKTGAFTDLCRGPHVANSREIGAFKLTKIAGAYWRGNENNPQLQRIYGVAFATQAELDAYLVMMEEAAKRDHRKLAKELELVVFSDKVGAGLPLWTPKGTLVRGLLDEFVWQERKKRGYQKVEIPHITKKELYETSGHWEKYAEELFHITTREGHEFAMKPMNCPHHTQLYDAQQRSYRDLPIRYANTTMCYRDEQTGELHGFSRTRAFTQDDAHVFCRASQIQEEFFKVWDIIDMFYGAFQFILKPRLSFHDPAHAEKYLGTAEVWKKAEDSIRAMAQARGVHADVAIGEAAFYGPKVDFMAIDSIGRSWQVATIQLDMNLPERFDLNCMNESGEKERIFMIHAAIMGSIERFMAVMIEHVAGAFPLWLAPVQVGIASVSEKHNDYCETLAKRLSDAGLRVECDLSAETVGKKIRGASSKKYPYSLVVGDKEMSSDRLSVRVRGQKDLWDVSEQEFIQTSLKKIDQRDFVV